MDRRTTNSDARLSQHENGQRCLIVPPYLLARIAAASGDPRLTYAPQAAAESLRRDDPFREWRRPEAAGVLRPPTTAREPVASGSPDRTISDAEHLEKLPGVVVRREGEPAVSDVTVNEAYDGLGDTFDLFWEVYGRSSMDGDGMPLEATVHYGENYDNAFWDGERMVFGDGDGEVFNRFTIAVDVVGHELAHGMTDATAKLEYRGQSGALNESVSDVFGALVSQYAQRQTADQASWLIGEGLFTDQVQGVALRSLRAPGTAYDDDVLGKDPQPSHWRDFVVTDEDNGGVHINSGIPNHAFYLVATALGGNAWERAGQIWYDAVTGGNLPTDATFARFAAVTIAAATERFGADSEETDAVSAAWSAVGVTPEA